MIEENKNYFLPFPTRLRQLMDDTGASQQALADYVGVTRQAVAQWKDGKTIPDMYNFKRTAEFFKVPYEYLLGDTDSKVHENMALARSLGLSDDSIETLQGIKEFSEHDDEAKEYNSFGKAVIPMNEMSVFHLYRARELMMKILEDIPQDKYEESIGIR